jgi:hypothetical protein
MRHVTRKFFRQSLYQRDPSTRAFSHRRSRRNFSANLFPPILFLPVEGQRPAPIPAWGNAPDFHATAKPPSGRECGPRESLKRAITHQPRWRCNPHPRPNRRKERLPPVTVNVPSIHPAQNISLGRDALTKQILGHSNSTPTGQWSEPNTSL